MVVIALASYNLKIGRAELSYIGLRCDKNCRSHLAQVDNLRWDQAIPAQPRPLSAPGWMLEVGSKSMAANYNGNRGRKERRGRLLVSPAKPRL
jgi:hypothetical protein